MGLRVLSVLYCYENLPALRTTINNIGQVKNAINVEGLGPDFVLNTKL